MATPSTSPTAARNWLGSRTDPTQMTNIVKALNNPPFASLKESRTLLRRIVLTNSLPPLVREQAIGMLARADLRSETKLLRVVLKGELRGGDFPDVYPNEKDPDRKIAISSDTELRDAALGYAVLQDNLSIRDFGFVTPSGFNPAFKSEEQRSFGYGKWGWKLMKESVALLAKNTKPKKDEPK
jgi:hypothetical protein